MTIVEYKVKGNIDINKFVNYPTLAREIRKIIPGEDFQINEIINGAYIKKRKGKIDMIIQIIIQNHANHREEFEKIKHGLEKVLKCELTE